MPDELVFHIDEETSPPAPEVTVPTWLAAMVLILLMIAFTLVGFVVRGFLADEPVSDGSLERAEQAVEDEPEGVQAHLDLAFELQNAGKHEEALEQYAFVLEREPANLEAMFQRGRLFQEMGDEDAAEEAFWDVLEVEPAHASAAKALAEIYGSRAEYRSMLFALEEASRLNPAVADLHFLRGIAYEKLGRTDEARAAYEQALRYAPDMTEASEGLARVGEP